MIKMRASRHYAMFPGSIDLFMWNTDTRKIITNVTVSEEPYDEGMTGVPLARLSVEDAQTLMDDLWEAGLRPTEGTGSAGALAATQKHLDDMRRLVFGDKSEKK